MRLYGELAGWFHLLTAPESYAEEAAVYVELLRSRGRGKVETMLELGCGGGNNAVHMKETFRMTLSDLSPAMLEVSRGLNPECEHLVGDMRTMRLGRTFDAVFVHDAVMYMTTADELDAAIATAAAHCRPGGVALFAPDCVAETFHEYDHAGGHDGADGRRLRYRERVRGPDPADGTCRVDLAIRLREVDGTERTVEETHRFGLFAEGDWLDRLTRAGLVGESVPVALGGEGRPTSRVFVGRKR